MAHSVGLARFVRRIIALRWRRWSAAVSNDSDPDGDVITVTAVTGGMGAYISGGSTVGVVYGTYGTLTYTLTDANGATDTATISVSNFCESNF